MLPSTIGHYQLHEEIGRGGMAVVYRATDVRQGRVVALKVLPPHLAYDEKYLTRFLREGRAAARLDHPNIVHVYEAGAVDGRYFMSLQFIDGATLTVISGPDAWKDALAAADLELRRALSVDAPAGRAQDLLSSPRDGE